MKLNMMKKMNSDRIVTLLLLVICFGAFNYGCSHSRQYSKNEEVVTTGNPQQTVTGTQTTVTSEKVVEQSRSDEHRGFVGQTVHVVGQIIALPFRLVAGLFEAIF